MPVSLQRFAERLAKCGLFTAEELSAFQEGLPPEKRPQSAQDLARELILAERLTRFQAEAVYRGHLKGLVMGEYRSLSSWCIRRSSRRTTVASGRPAQKRWPARWHEPARRPPARNDAASS